MSSKLDELSLSIGAADIFDESNGPVINMIVDCFVVILVTTIIPIVLSADVIICPYFD